MGVDCTRSHLTFARTAFATQEHRLLVIERFDRCRDDMGLSRQHRPLEIKLDHGIRCRNVKGLECLPSTIRHEGTVTIQIFLKSLAVHLPVFRILVLD
jgi:hypothetical protein